MDNGAAGVLLVGGASRRFGSPKPLARIVFACQPNRPFGPSRP